MEEQIARARAEGQSMAERLRAIKEHKNDTTLKAATNDVPALPKFEKLKHRRTLRGHLAKVYAMHWSAENYLVSASGDGKLLVWDALTTHKTSAIPLRSTWVMTCAYAPTGNFVACGGLDNICSVYNLRSKEVPIRVARELNAHSGYLSCARFLSDRKIVTSSGDGTCILWDIESAAKVTEFNHGGDVMSVDISPDLNYFVSGSVASTNKLWDLRAGKEVSLFEGHEADVNFVKYFPNGNAFASGSDDSTCRLFDIRADRELCNYHNPSILCGVTSVDFSLSGRLLFAGYDDFSVHIWDVLKGERAHNLAQAHENRVSCLGVSHDGMALCTGGWDSILKIWA